MHGSQLRRDSRWVAWEWEVKRNRFRGIHLRSSKNRVVAGEEMPGISIVLITFLVVS